MATSDAPWRVAGKTCLVTGATSGIGRALAEQLAQAGARVLLVARDRTRGADALNTILTANPGARADLLLCDLSSMRQVRQLAANVAEMYGTLDVLVNNAGVSKFGRTVTDEGLETTFAVNHLAPFLLTNLLLGPLQAAGQARIVTVTSDMHARVRSIPWDDLQQEHAAKPTGNYERTKLMNIWFTRVLAQRLARTGVTANCVAPGFIHTGLGREARGAFGLFLKLVRPFQKPPEHGAARVMHLAAAADLNTVTGAYFNNGKQATPSALARDDKAASRLWEVSTELCGLPAVP
jgi:retinol dehydrogenase 12